jgi:large subunit ribosomal protein L4
VTELAVRSPNGDEVGSATVPGELFDAQVNIPLIHQVVVAQLAAARQGTHDTRTRGEVSGGGRKPYRQKGTGRARQGSIRAPQFAGGGVVHGPSPRSYQQRTPKKMKTAALLGALSDRARAGRLHVLTGLLDGEEPSTNAAARALGAITDRRRLLVVAERSDDLTCKSVRNIERVHLIAPDQLNTYDVLVVDDVVFTQGAMSEFLATRGHQFEVRPVAGNAGRAGARPARRGSRRRARDGDRCRSPGGRHRRGASGRGGVVSDDPRSVLLAPVISEKSYGLLDLNKYTFLVDRRANKSQIKIAVERVFKVKVTEVNTANRAGKRKRTRFGWGRRNATKRAIVTLVPGDRIDIFGGPVS